MRLRAQSKKLAKLQVSLRFRKFLVAKQLDMPYYQTSETLNLRRSIVSTTGKTEKCIYICGLVLPTDCIILETYV